MKEAKKSKFIRQLIVWIKKVVGRREETGEYILADAGVLLELISALPLGQEFNFAADYLDDMCDVDPESALSGWYGIRKQKLFDCVQILVGYLGGGEVMVYENDEYLLDDLQQYLNDIPGGTLCPGKVYVKCPLEIVQ